MATLAAAHAPSLLAPPPPKSEVIVPVEQAFPRRRTWTRTEFERLIEAGAFGPEERLELLDGEIITKMTQNEPHAVALRLADRALNRIFGEGFDVRNQSPLALGEADRPEPDLAVVVGGPRDYLAGHPTTALLVAEVSDTTLAFDRTIKAGQYARAVIAELWIVNLRDHVLEVFRQPAAMADQPLGHHYRSVTRHTDDEAVALLAAPNAPVRVADLLP